MEVTRRLGIRTRIDGSTEPSAEHTMKRAYLSLRDVQVWRFKHAAPRLLDMLVNSQFNFGAILLAIPRQELKEYERTFISQTISNQGLTTSDNLVRTFLPEKGYCGYQVRSPSQVILTNIAREMEVLLNGNNSHNRLSRARLDGTQKDENRRYPSFAREAIDQLAQCGVMIRDSREHVFGLFMDKLQMKCKQYPIGYHKNKDKSLCILSRSISNQSESFGLAGDYSRGLSTWITECNKNKALEPWYNAASERDWKETIECWKKMNKEPATSKPQWMRSLRAEIKSPKTLHTIMRETFGQIEAEHKIMLTFYEWRHPLTEGEPPFAQQLMYLHPEEWIKKEPEELPWDQADIENQDKFLWEQHDKFIESHRLNPENEKDLEILKQAGYPDRPLFIAVDGGHIPDDDPVERRTSASMVLFMQPEPNDWQNEKNLTPLVIRIMQLPPSIGDTDSHGSHGEQVGLCLTYEAVPLGYPIINVNDSTVARSNFLSLRDKTWNSDRNKIRDVLSGNSKHLSARLERQLEMHEKEPEGKQRTKK